VFDLVVKDVASCDFDLVVKALWFTIAFDIVVKATALTTRSKRGGLQLRSTKMLNLI
jgi:hypothetical protein